MSNKSFLRRVGKKTHKINTIMVQGLLNQIDCNHVVSRDNLNLVYDYLFQKRTMGVLWDNAIGNLYHLFEIDYIYRVGKEILERTHYYEKNRQE